MYEPYYLKDVLDASAQKKFTVISTFALVCYATPLVMVWVVVMFY